MSDQAKMSMILCRDLEPDEREKVERLDGPISATFKRAGYVVRVCQGRTDGDKRLLNFQGPTGVVASVPADEFVAASDNESVDIIARSCA